MMNASTITVHWHDDNQPVYSVDFQPVNGRGSKRSERLVTAGGDNNVRIWKVKYTKESEKDDDVVSAQETSISGVKDAKIQGTTATVEYLSTLKKHTQAVNVVRFDKKGEVLATAGDDGTLILWTLSDHIVKEFGSEDDEELKESWIVKHIFRSSTSEIYDLSWSPDSKYIATGSMDNITRIYNVSTGQQAFQLAEHNHYVQGITWDPRNEFLATQSADRSVHIYSLINKEGIDIVPTLYFKISRSDLPVSKLSSVESIDTVEDDVNLNCTTQVSTPPAMSPPTHTFVHDIKSPSRINKKILSADVLPAVRPSIKKRNTYLYHSETLQSFFRRLSFSPDGSLLLTTSGIYKTNTSNNSEILLNASHTQVANTEENTQDENNNEDVTNTVFIYTRSGLNKSPVCHIPGLKKPAIAIRFSPIIYETSTSIERPAFTLPYKMIFAVATQDSIVIYNTESLSPLGVVSNLHYSTITDLVWDLDGQSIIVSSADGFCSCIKFDEGVFGNILYNSNECENFWEQSRKKPDENLSKKKLMDGTSIVAKPLLNILPKKQGDVDEKQNTIDQLFKSSKDPSKDSSNNNSQEKKKRRIVPTLITKE